MRPLTAALVVLLIVTAAAVAIAVWASGSGDPAASPDTGAVPTSTPTSEPTATPEPEYDFPTADSVGDCFDPIYDVDDGALLAMRLWPCDEPHLSEVIGLELIDRSASATWPGQAAVDAEAEEICLDLFLDYVGVPYSRSSINMSYFSPTRETWEVGDRQVWCMAETTTAAPFTSTVRGIRE